MTHRHRFLITACLAGLLVNCLLAFWKLTDPSGHILGCGAGNGCSGIFSSRWSEVFGLPVAVLGVLLYVGLYAVLVWENGRIAPVCYGVIAGSAIWLSFVQWVILQQFCPWCMAAHGIGMLVVIGGMAVHWDEEFVGYSFLAGILMSFGLSLGQLYGPVPASHAVERIQPAGVPDAGDVHAVGTGRKVSFNEGRIIFDCAAMPHLGSADAEHVLVEYFDYQCPACRKMRDYLAALVDAHPKQVCVLVLPVPLEHGCNPALPETEEGHKGSCDLTRIALAVWRINPDAYPVIHRQFMSDPPMDRATALAFAHVQVDRSKMEAALKDPWIDRLIKANVADWAAFSGERRILPQLLINQKRILHGLPSGRKEFIRVMEQELGLSPKD